MTVPVQFLNRSCSVAMIPGQTTDALSSKPTTHQTHNHKKQRCKWYTTPFANTSQPANRNCRLRTPPPLFATEQIDPNVSSCAPIREIQMRTSMP
jgi:hypothetical protein